MQGEIRICGLESVTAESTRTGKTEVGLEPGDISDRKVPDDSQSQRTSGWWGGLAPLGRWSCDLSPSSHCLWVPMLPGCPSVLQQGHREEQT